MISETIHVTAVEPRNGYRLVVSFDDGAVKEVDLSCELAAARGVFLALRDPRVFAAADQRIGSRRMAW